MSYALLCPAIESKNKEKGIFMSRIGTEGHHSFAVARHAVLNSKTDSQRLQRLETGQIRGMLTWQADWQLWVEADIRDMVAVALQGLHTGLGLVVPNLGQLVISTTDQIGPVACQQQSLNEGRTSAVKPIVSKRTVWKRLVQSSGLVVLPWAAAAPHLFSWGPRPRVGSL